MEVKKTEETKEVKETGETKEVKKIEETKEVKETGETKREAKEEAKEEAKIDGEIWQTWSYVKRQTEIKGIKMMNTDMTGWNGYEFEVGKEYTQSGYSRVANNGFHYWLNAQDLVLGTEYLHHLSTDRMVVEVTDLGTSRDYSNGRVATNKIRIDRIIPREEWLKRSDTTTQVEYRAGKLFSVRHIARTASGLRYNSNNDEAAVTIYVTANLSPVLYENVDFEFTEPGVHQYWYKLGERHRDGDKPAIVAPGVTQYWQNNQLHRDGDKPAIINETTGEKQWCKRGRLHRDVDEPARIRACGAMEYYKYGNLHRYNLPAVVDKNYKPVGYYVNGLQKTANSCTLTGDEWNAELKSAEARLLKTMESRITQEGRITDSRIYAAKKDFSERNKQIGIAATALIGGSLLLLAVTRRK